MTSKIKQLSLRILFIPVSGFFVLQVFSLFVRSLNDVIYFLTNKTDYHIFMRYDTRDALIIFFSVFWIISLILLEIYAIFVENFRFRRLLTNLRFAPIFILLFSTAIVIVFDLGMIEYSKLKIRNYLYNESVTIEKPEFVLHNNYRHWCGNGFSAQENYLYFDTAAEGFNSESPYVRSRSLLMTAAVQDRINGGDDRFDYFLAKSCQDSDPIVRATAENYLNRWNESDCKKLLSAK